MSNPIFQTPVVIAESPNMPAGVHKGFAIGITKADAKRTQGYDAVIMNYVALTSLGNWSTADELLWMPQGAIITNQSLLVRRLAACSGIAPKVGVDLSTLVDYGPVTIQVEEEENTSYNEKGKATTFKNAKIINVMPRELEDGELLPEQLGYNKETGELVLYRPEASEPDF